MLDDDTINAMIGNAAMRQNSVLLGGEPPSESLTGMLCADVTNLVTIIEDQRAKIERLVAKKQRIMSVAMDVMDREQYKEFSKKLKDNPI